MLNTASPKTITGTVIETARPKGKASHSTNGNPNFDVTIRLDAIDGTPVDSSADALRTVVVRTAPDSGLAYGITNPEFAYVPHTFTLNARGKLRSAVKA